MTPTEFRPAPAGAKRGKVVTHRQILKKSGGRTMGIKPIIWVYIAHLREKIEASPSRPNCSSLNRSGLPPAATGSRSAKRQICLNCEHRYNPAHFSLENNGAMRQALKLFAQLAFLI